jgi:hypothetical protein
MKQPHALRQPVLRDVELGDGRRPGRQLDGVDFCLRELVREQDGEAARAGADVDRPLHRPARRQPLRQLLRDDLQEIGARDDDALVDMEAVFAEPRLAGQVGRGHVLLQPAAEDLRDLRGFLLREFLFQHRRPAGERQAERAEQQVERLVVCGHRHLAERDLAPGVLALRPGQPFTERAG